MSERPNTRTALLVAGIASFMTPFLGSSLSLALPAIGSEFQMSAVLLGWVQASYLLSSAALLIPIGRIADITGQRRVFLTGVSLYTLSSLLSGLAPSPALLLTARVLQGVSGAMMFGISVAMLMSVFPPGERGAALGINTAAVYAGLSLGPFVGGVLTESAGWRSIFLVHVPLGLLMVVMILWKLRADWVEPRAARFDSVGSGLYGVSLVVLLYGLPLLPGIWGVACIVAGLGGLAGFVAWERRVPSPVLDVSLLFRNRAFTFSNLAALINYAATFAVTFLLSLYLQYVRGFSPRDAGLILVVQPVLMAIGSPFAGRVSDRIEPRIVASAGMVLLAAGLAGFAFLTGSTPIGWIVANLALLGIGFALFSSPNSNAVMSSVDRPVYGVAAGILATMRLTGQAASLSIAMMVLALIVGGVELAPPLYPALLRSTNVAFAVFAFLGFVGVFASLVRGNVREVPDGRSRG